MARVELTDDALEDLKGFDGSAQRQILKGIKKLEDSPEQRGAPLGSRQSGNLTSYRKLVVGNRQYRIVYSVHEDGTICIVWVIGPRSDDEVYEMATARLSVMGDRELAERLRSMLDQINGR
ncbi:type II toxin-antitoxin system RelE/ParE family toxin [Kineococcus sp. TBRC 1896]|uniref:Type II toxin-antitoxin system RelE/ParE family toxin n=1 Tax=Kineococcus mangrovi TaxID=1660183 RepID=A0ABV4I131_9ACTN